MQRQSAAHLDPSQRHSRVFAKSWENWLEVGTAVIIDGAGARRLSRERLYRPCDLSRIAFRTTAELEPVSAPVGQARAFEAVRLGTQIDKVGFNLFVIGPNGVGMREAVKAVLVEEAKSRPRSPDWVYVNNFAKPDRPIAI